MPTIKDFIARSAFCLCLIAGQDAQAQPTADDLSEEGFAYVAGSMLSVFYHELGHAFIDLLDLPVFGPEEDAADTLAAVLTHEIWEEEGARQNASAYALSWLISAAEMSDEGFSAEDFGEVHALDLQRHYRHVCLFYGADPAARADFAADFELPAGRAESCAEEYAQADRAWGRVLRDLAAEKEGLRAGLQRESLRWQGEGEGQIAEVLRQEVQDLNARYYLPARLNVALQDCGEANAFYVPDEKTVIICQEFIDYLTAQAVALEL